MLKKIKKVLVFGDSLLKGVVLGDNARHMQLSDSTVAEVSRSVNIGIENNSVFGMTAKKAASRFFSGKRREEFADSAVLIEYGGNDCNFNWDEIAKRPYDTHEPMTSLADFEAEVHGMVKFVRRAGGFPVLMTLPPLQPEKFLTWVTRNGADRENIIIWLGDVAHIYRWQERYNLAINRIALRTKTPVIDIRERFLAQGRYEDYLCEDGMHVNRLGHMLMADTFIKFVNANRAHFE